MKILISRAAKANKPNVNGVLYSEDVLKKSLEKRINALGHIPVTLQGPYYGLWDSADFQSVNVNDIIGYVKSLDDIHDTGIYVHLKDTLEPKSITKIIDRVTEGYQLGLRYIAEIETNESEDIKHVKDGTMIVICYDLIKVRVTD